MIAGSTWSGRPAATDPGTSMAATRQTAMVSERRISILLGGFDVESTHEGRETLSHAGSDVGITSTPNSPHAERGGRTMARCA